MYSSRPIWLKKNKKRQTCLLPSPLKLIQFLVFPRKTAFRNNNICQVRIARIIRNLWKYCVSYTQITAWETALSVSFVFKHKYLALNSLHYLIMVNYDTLYDLNKQWIYYDASTFECCILNRWYYFAKTWMPTFIATTRIVPLNTRDQMKDYQM